MSRIAREAERILPAVRHSDAHSLHRSRALAVTEAVTLGVLALFATSIVVDRAGLSGSGATLMTLLFMTMFYGSLIVTGSFYLKRFIGGQKGWRWLHYATFTLFIMALVHGLLSGTDDNLRTNEIEC